MTAAPVMLNYAGTQAIYAIRRNGLGYRVKTRVRVRDMVRIRVSVRVISLHFSSHNPFSDSVRGASLVRNVLGC